MHLRGEGSFFVQCRRKDLNELWMNDENKMKRDPWRQADMDKNVFTPLICCSHTEQEMDLHVAKVEVRYSTLTAIKGMQIQMHSTAHMHMKLHLYDLVHVLYKVHAWISLSIHAV